MLKHIRRWYIWQKDSHEDLMHKFLVLIGLAEAPAMVWELLPEEIGEISEAFKRGMRGGM